MNKCFRLGFSRQSSNYFISCHSPLVLPHSHATVFTYSTTISVIGIICPRTCQFRCTTFVYTDPRAVNPTPWLILYLVGSRCRIRTHSPGYQKPLRYQLRQSAIKLMAPTKGFEPPTLTSVV